MTKESKFDPKVFAETKRDPVTHDELDAVMRQMMTQPARPKTRSENREPSREELAQRWKFSRR